MFRFDLQTEPSDFLDSNATSLYGGLRVQPSLESKYFTSHSVVLLFAFYGQEWEIKHTLEEMGYL